MISITTFLVAKYLFLLPIYNNAKIYFTTFFACEMFFYTMLCMYYLYEKKSKE